MGKMTPRGIPSQLITSRTAGRSPGRPGQAPDDPAQRPVGPGQRPARVCLPIFFVFASICPYSCVNVYECSDDDMYI